MKSLKPQPLDSLKSLLGVADPEAAVPVLGAASVSALAVGLSAASRDGAAKGAVAAGLAFDLVGGLVALHWPSNRRAFTRKGIPERLLFTGLHVQPFVLPAIGQGTWGHAARRYLTALGVSAALELLVPRSRLRPAIATAAAAVLAVEDWRRGRGWRNRWLGPVLLLKLIGGHAGIRRSGGVPTRSGERSRQRGRRKAGGVDRRDPPGGRAEASSRMSREPLGQFCPPGPGVVSARTVRPKGSRSGSASLWERLPNRSRRWGVGV